MSKHQSKESPSRETAPEEPVSMMRCFREIIDTLAVALILALLFKTFEAEAFVIPTGSMAPTLMGKHKDLNCSQCGFRFQVSASEEFDEGNRGLTSQRRAAGKKEPQVVGGTCPQCRYTMFLGENGEVRKNYPSFNGDRILVFRYYYDMVEPERWSITVFRFPGGPQTNFIKRLIGLESETVRIQNGNIFIAPGNSGEFRISRKPARHLLSMLQLVHDNEYVVPELHRGETHWPTSWADQCDVFGRMSLPGVALEPVWIASEDLRSFETRAPADQVRWLNYRHIVPNSDDWFYLQQGKAPPPGDDPHNPQLITDFSAYNSGIVKDSASPYSSEDASFRLYDAVLQSDGVSQEKTLCRADPDSVGFNWDGDLVVECRLQVKEAAGVFALRLIKGGVSFLCEIDLSSGNATLSVAGYENEFPPVSCKTKISKTGSYRLRFANVDEQMRLWVDETEQEFPGQGQYDHLCEGENASLPRDRGPGAQDLTPVSLGARGTHLAVDRLRVLRDIYYIASSPHLQSDMRDLQRQNLFHSPSSPDAERKNGEILACAIPEVWEELGKTRVAEFPLAKDQFFVMGDNSAKSMDARTWTAMPGGGQYVPRRNMIGDAAVVFWPHGWPLPVLRWKIVPNPGDMRFIR